MAYVKPDEWKTKVAKLHREGEERAAQRLAEKLGLEYADLAKTPVTLDAIRIIPEGDAQDAKVAAIQASPSKVALGVVNPELPATKKMIEVLKAKNYEVK